MRPWWFGSEEDDSERHMTGALGSGIGGEFESEDGTEIEDGCRCVASMLMV
jgi:hypothetical protein